MTANCPALCLNAHPLRLDTVPPLCAMDIAGQQAPTSWTADLHGVLGFWRKPESVWGVRTHPWETSPLEGYIKPAAIKRVCAPGTAWTRLAVKALHLLHHTRGLRAPGMLPGESLPWHQAQTFMVIFQAARTWGNITSQASTQAGFSIHCFNASGPVPQAHPGTLQ